jgi:hypothetical protein
MGRRPSPKRKRLKNTKENSSLLSTVKCVVNVQNEREGAKANLYSSPESKAVTGTVKNHAFVYLSGEERRVKGHSWVSVDVLINADKGFAEATVEASGRIIPTAFHKSCRW